MHLRVAPKSYVYLLLSFSAGSYNIASNRTVDTVEKDFFRTGNGMINRDQVAFCRE